MIYLQLGLLVVLAFERWLEFPKTLYSLIDSMKIQLVYFM